MRKQIRVAFKPTLVELPLRSLVASREVDPRERHHAKYQQIAISLEIVGMIEPLVVWPESGGKYRLLDGHKRWDLLRRRGIRKAICIVAKSDEAYTYNSRVNYLSPVGEHKMILRALEHNSEERIAQALDVEIATIRRKQKLLDGISRDVIDLLGAKQIAAKAFTGLRRMAHAKQLVVARLMIASKNYSGRFVNALLTDVERRPNHISTPGSLPAGVDDDLAQSNVDSLVHRLDRVKKTYGMDALKLDLSCCFISRMLSNSNIRNYLAKRHGQTLNQLEAIVAAPAPPGQLG